MVTEGAKVSRFFQKACALKTGRAQQNACIHDGCLKTTKAAATVFVGQWYWYHPVHRSASRRSRRRLQPGAANARARRFGGTAVDRRCRLAVGSSRAGAES